MRLGSGAILHDSRVLLKAEEINGSKGFLQALNEPIVRKRTRAIRLGNCRHAVYSAEATVCNWCVRLSPICCSDDCAQEWVRGSVVVVRLIALI